MSQNSVMEIRVGDLIRSPTTQYQVLKFLNSGSHGNVVKCTNVSTNETVAVKMISMMHIKWAEKEEATLKTLKQLHSDEFNIATLYDSFTHEGYYCLVFEHLDIDLNKFMQSTPDEHLRLEQIRPILEQLAASLDYLESVGIVHADLRPQKIMMVDHVIQPLKVKIIGFGSACTNPEEQIGDVQQNLIYRSPEILRKTPFDQSIDVWSLGCIATRLFTGIPLFSASIEEELVQQILFSAGSPLHDGNFLPYWFWPKYWMARSMMTPAELQDLECFVHLLKDMLQMNPSHRITPRQILKSQFITMSHFEGQFRNCSYVKRCQDLMDICQDLRSGGGRHRHVVIKTKSPTGVSSSSTAGPAGEGDSAGMREEKPSFLQTSTINNRPDDSQAGEQLAATGKDTSGQMGPEEPQKEEEKMDDPTGDGNHSKKKRNVSFKKGQVQPRFMSRRTKRKAEEAPVLEKTRPVKKKRAYRRKTDGCLNKSSDKLSL